MNRYLSICLLFTAVTLQAQPSAAKRDFNTFLNTYFEVYETTDSLEVLGEGIAKGFPKKQVDKNDELYDFAIKYFPSQYFSLYACHINNYYILIFYTDHAIDDEYEIDDHMFVLCNERGDILDRYIHRKIVRTYMVWYRYYLQNDRLIWRYCDETVSLDAYIEQQFTIIKDRIIPL